MDVPAEISVLPHEVEMQGCESIPRKPRGPYGEKHGRIRRDYREAGEFMCVIDVVTWISSGGAVRLNGKVKISQFMMFQRLSAIEKWLAAGVLKRAIVISERRQVPRDLERNYAGSEVRK